MNIFKMNKEEREKAINSLLDNISAEQLLEELIQEGLEIKENDVAEQIYKLKPEAIIINKECKSILESTFIEQEYKLMQKPIIAEKQYKPIQEYEQTNYLNIFDIHTNSTSKSFISRLLKRKIEVGDVA